MDSYNVPNLLIFIEIKVKKRQNQTFVKKLDRMLSNSKTEKKNNKLESIIDTESTYPLLSSQGVGSCRC